MLYQLSYLGTSRTEGPGAPVYSQAGQLCPPGFAFGYAGRGPASLAYPAGRGHASAVPPNDWELTPYSASSSSSLAAGMV